MNLTPSYASLETRIKDPSIISDGIFCGISKQLSTVNYYHKELFILDVAVVLDLDPSLK